MSGSAYGRLGAAQQQVQDGHADGDTVGHLLDDHRPVGVGDVGGRVHVGSGMQHIVGTVDRKLYVLALPGDRRTPSPSPVPTPSGNASFTAIYDEIFVGQGCNGPFCHGANAGELSLTTKEGAYQALVGVAAAGDPCATSGLLRVDPGNLAGSLLWEKVATRLPLCGDPMPIAAALPNEDIEQIRRWIERGAPND